MREEEKKITRATFKSFINKNAGNLLIKCKSDFDGMVDCVMENKNPIFKPCTKDERGFNKNTLGIMGVWLVGHSSDYFGAYRDEIYRGITVNNCCGSFILTTKQEG